MDWDGDKFRWRVAEETKDRFFIQDTWPKLLPADMLRPLLLFSLFLVARARSFFRKYQKKKKNFLRDRPSCCPPAPGHTRLCLQVAWHDDWKPQSRRESRESHFQVVAWAAKIVKGSSFKLQSSWGRSIKTEKRWPSWSAGVCWNFSSLRCSRQRSKLDKGGAGRWPLWLCAIRCFVSKYEGKYRHKVELSTRVLCCPCFWEIVTVEGLAEERDSERTREKTHAFSRMSTSVTQCAATLQGKRPPKGTGIYQEQENFWRDRKLHNNIIDLLSSDKVGFRTDGSEMSADYWTRKWAR